ncbi:MAG: dihydrolipoamide acetyltransferase family protein [Myxococcota bacterium]|nr:dihydrolipoamide acetyltransferase family protein [Myxococcota bacterium]
MSISIELPALGESVVEGTVARWLVAEGEAVERDQPLVEVTTDKVDAEVPSPAAGVIEKILVAEGETVAVGAQLAVIGSVSRAAPEAAPGSAPSAAAEVVPPESSVTPMSASAGEPKATPVARRLAEDAALDLAAVEATGAGGRITKHDVLRHADVRSAVPAPRAPIAASVAGRPPWAHYELQDGDRVVAMTPQRRLIAQHMVYSKHTSPHVGTVAEIDMGGVAALRAQHKRAFQQTHGVALTFLPFIVHAVVRALRDYPALNASVMDDAIVEKRSIHVGIAVETEKGLLVPVVRHADRLSLAGLAAAIDDLSTRARSKKLSPDELRGGTITISNPGRMGNLYGFAIINQPQVAILRMGEMVKRPVVRSVDGEDAILIRPMMHLALSYDHRALDGQPANGFLFRIRELLESAEVEL